LKQCLILLVEDDRNDAFLIGRALKDLGFDGRLEHVADTHSARAYLSADGQFADRQKFPAPDIVVSDSILPGRGSGIELLEWMRKENFPETPFVILSGEITPDVRERANAAGVQLLLQKGSSFKNTANALREALLQMPPECREWLRP
jgi:CheY-like chemotaxis protein